MNPKLDPPDLFVWRFNGADYQPERDNVRLGAQLRGIFDLMMVYTMASKWRVERCHCGLARIAPGSLAATLNAESAASGKPH